MVMYKVLKSDLDWNLDWRRSWNFKSCGSQLGMDMPSARAQWSN